jgi:hypothetical protein
MEQNNDKATKANPNIEASYDDTVNFIINPITAITAHILIVYDMFPITD